MSSTDRNDQPTNASPAVDGPRHFWVVGLILLAVNMYLSALSVTTRSAGDPFVARYTEALIKGFALDAYVLGAVSGPVIVAAFVLGIALMFRRVRNRRTSSVVMVVAMTVILLPRLVFIALGEVAALNG